MTENFLEWHSISHSHKKASEVFCFENNLVDYGCVIFRLLFFFYVCFLCIQIWLKNVVGKYWILNLSSTFSKKNQVSWTTKRFFVFGVFLNNIFPHSDWIRSRKTPNMDYFHTVMILTVYPLWSSKINCRFLQNFSFLNRNYIYVRNVTRSKTIHKWKCWKI